MISVGLKGGGVLKKIVTLHSGKSESRSADRTDIGILVIVVESIDLAQAPIHSSFFKISTPCNQRVQNPVSTCATVLPTVILCCGRMRAHGLNNG